MHAITRLTMSAEIGKQILLHARDALPREAVGLLGGSADGQAILVLPLPNVAGGQREFLADPYVQFRALQRLRSENLQLLAIYHSHPDGGTGPSEDDLVHARRWSCVQMIVALSTSPPFTERFWAFRCADHGLVEEIEIRIGG
jgi:proteasome lid subunit RPN8/RPN11